MHAGFDVDQELPGLGHVHELPRRNVAFSVHVKSSKRCAGPLVHQVVGTQFEERRGRPAERVNGGIPGLSVQDNVNENCTGASATAYLLKNVTYLQTSNWWDIGRLVHSPSGQGLKIRLVQVRVHRNGRTFFIIVFVFDKVIVGRRI